MKDKDSVLLLAEADDAHALLIQRNVKRSGLTNEVVHFRDGREVIDFLTRKGNGPHRKKYTPYLLLLSLNMPKVKGVDVLFNIKQNLELQLMPVVILTNIDDQREIEICYRIGCNGYIVKPADSEVFAETVKQFCTYLQMLEVPRLI